MSSPFDESRRENIGPEDAESSALRQALDEVTQQLLQARDAVAGAEAELGVAKARVREVEHQLHVTTVEVNELREQILLLGAAEGIPSRSGLATGQGMAKRLSPLLTRTARLVR